MNLQNIESIKVSWISKEDSTYYAYRLVAGSIVNNQNEIGFELENCDGNDDNYQVVIRETGDGYVFRSDAYDDPETEYDLSLFQGSNETILYCEDESEVIYFHLS